MGQATAAWRSSSPSLQACQPVLSAHCQCSCMKGRPAGGGAARRSLAMHLQQQQQQQWPQASRSAPCMHPYLMCPGQLQPAGLDRACSSSSSSKAAGCGSQTMRVVMQMQQQRLRWGLQQCSFPQMCCHPQLPLLSAVAEAPAHLRTAAAAAAVDLCSLPRFSSSSSRVYLQGLPSHPQQKQQGLQSCRTSPCSAAAAAHLSARQATAQMMKKSQRPSCVQCQAL